MAQMLRGVVLDAKTNKPMETVSVYFDNTTIGTITNSKGEFSISYSKAIKSPLIISFLGYEKQIIKEYRGKRKLTILLKDTPEVLEEVLISANDGMSRKQKLRFFRREFLGYSRFGRSCTILNEDDIILRYNKKDRTLTAHSKVPLRIENKALQYLVSYDLTSFILNFENANNQNYEFGTRSVAFIGNTFYQNLESFDEQKASKNRQSAYRGSRLKFMRALYASALEENNFEIFNNNQKVSPWDFFLMESKNDTSIKQVLLLQPMDVIYDKRKQSTIQFIEPSIFVDAYGNYSNVTEVRFSGDMGDQRVGELLPFDYGLK